MEMFMISEFKWIMFFLMMGAPLLALALETKNKDDYRVYDETTPQHVRDFYRFNHENQTLDFVLEQKKKYLTLDRKKMGIWDAVKLVDTLVDESDPDLNLPQSFHSYQTAEALRRDGYPRWMILVGFIHDLGKVLTFYGEPQWAVVGDTFPVGCAFSDKIVFPEYFAVNPDSYNSFFHTSEGIYHAGCGLDHVHLSWGHDEYLYQVVKNYLPEEAGYIIRYHSFYAAHREGAYQHLMNEDDRKMMEWVRIFSHYDLYSKNDEPLDVEGLKPYYQELIAEFFPEKIDW
jgi:inositol oxygenase